MKTRKLHRWFGLGLLYGVVLVVMAFIATGGGHGNYLAPFCACSPFSLLLALNLAYGPFLSGGIFLGMLLGSVVFWGLWTYLAARSSDKDCRNGFLVLAAIHYIGICLGLAVAPKGLWWPDPKVFGFAFPALLLYGTGHCWLWVRFFRGWRRSTKEDDSPEEEAEPEEDRDEDEMGEPPGDSTAHRSRLWIGLLAISLVVVCAIIFLLEILMTHDRRIAIINTETGRREFFSKDSGSHLVAFEPRNSEFLSGDHTATGHTLHRVTLDGRILESWSAQPDIGWTRSIFSEPGGQRLACWDGSGIHLQIYDLSNHSIKRIHDDNSLPEGEVWWLKNNVQLLVVSTEVYGQITDGDNTVFLSDIERGELEVLVRLQDAPTGAALSPDERYLAFVEPKEKGAPATEVRVLDLETRTVSGLTSGIPSEPLSGCTWNSTGTLLSWVVNEETKYTPEMSPAEVVAAYQVPKSRICLMRFADKSTWEIKEPAPAGYASVIFLDDRRLLRCSSPRNGHTKTIEVFNAETGGVEREFRVRGMSWFFPFDGGKQILCEVRRGW